MAKPNYYPTEVRNLAHSIAEKAIGDPAFLQQLQDNPWETLRTAGLDDSVIPDFLAENGLQSEVSGYVLNENHCVTTTPSCYGTFPPHGGDI